MQLANNLREKEFGEFVAKVYAESQQKYETKHQSNVLISEVILERIL